MTDWERVWAARPLPPGRSTLERLMAADGLDTGFSGLSVADWSAGVAAIAVAIDLRPGESVFEVGCGAGAFLHDLAAAGHPVAGIDRSAALVGYARDAIPAGAFTVAEAAQLNTAQGADAVVSMGVFMYFPDLGYADEVIRRMAAKARRVVAVLDVPDAAKAAAARHQRETLAGGPEAYAERYAGLDHHSYDRAWMAERLEHHGLVDVRVADQVVPGYGNTPYRFNAWGVVPAADG